MDHAALGAKTVFSHSSLFQEKNAQLLGTAQQLFTHCQAQKEEIKRLFQQKLDEVALIWWKLMLLSHLHANIFDKNK